MSGDGATGEDETSGGSDGEGENGLDTGDGAGSTERERGRAGNETEREEHNGREGGHDVDRSNKREKRDGVQDGDGREETEGPDGSDDVERTDDRGRPRGGGEDRLRGEGDETGATRAGRRLHPLSVPYRTAARALRPSTIVLLVTAIGSGSVDPQSRLFVGLVAATLVATGAYQYGYYRRFEYVLTGDTLDVASGVISRRRREIPLRRVQNVDVGQNPVQRALGIAAVRIETAGGGDTEAVLEYLGREEAQRLRDDLRRAAGEASGETGESSTDGASEDDRTVSAPPEGPDREEVFTIPTRNLVVLSLFSFDAGAGVLSSLVGTLLSGGDPSNLVGVGRVLGDVPLSPVETALVGVAAVVLLAWLLSVVLTFARYYGFRLVRVDEGLQYERGLLQRFSGTIPVEKVQTVSLRESLVHRRLGYAAVAVETAGYSPGSDRSARQLAVPLARRDVAVRVARSVESFDVEDLDADRPPRRARRRYVLRFAIGVAVITGLAVGGLRVLAAADVGPGLTVDDRLVALPTVALLLTPLAAHLRWRNRGHVAGDDHFVARTGFWRRVTRVVPYYRVQTVVDSRTVFQRRRNLANVVADTASSASLLGGDAVAIDVDGATAGNLRSRLRSELERAIRTRTAEVDDGTERTADEREPAEGAVEEGDRAGDE